MNQQSELEKKILRCFIDNSMEIDDEEGIEYFDVEATIKRIAHLIDSEKQRYADEQDFNSIEAAKIRPDELTRPKHLPTNSDFSHSDKYMWSKGVNFGLDLAVRVLKEDLRKAQTNKAKLNDEGKV